MEVKMISFEQISAENKRKRYQSVAPFIDQFEMHMEKVEYCPSAIALVRIILGTAIVDPDGFTERADDILAILFGE